MAKRVFKGWIGTGVPMDDVIYWSRDIYVKEWNWLRLVELTIAKERSKKDDWGDEGWPPKRVTITVEIED